ncbi:MAG: hypothetical protein GY846_25495 [Deltaproteobacteria bacterium]|nr:hypothetical protein [Deltaproteobacteria bacterium]
MGASFWTDFFQLARNCFEVFGNCADTILGGTTSQSQKTQLNNEKGENAKNDKKIQPGKMFSDDFDKSVLGVGGMCSGTTIAHP